MSIARTNKSAIFTTVPSKNLALTFRGRPHAWVLPNEHAQQQELLFLGIQKNDEKSLFHNDRKKDKEAGILYLEMKKEGTPLYSISFNRSDQPFQLEARAEKGILNEALSLSEVYNCKFSTVGNLLIKPGKFIYISDPHFGDINTFVKQVKGQMKQNIKPSPTALYDIQNASRLLGIGGYFVITKTRHSIKSAGDRLQWKTEADCFWNSYGWDVEGAMMGTPQRTPVVRQQNAPYTPDPSSPTAAPQTPPDYTHMQGSVGGRRAAFDLKPPTVDPLTKARQRGGR